MGEYDIYIGDIHGNDIKKHSYNYHHQITGRIVISLFTETAKLQQYSVIGFDFLFLSLKNKF